MKLQVAIVSILATAALQGASADDAAAGAPTPLPHVTVLGEHASDGYLNDRSRTATKTDTALIDVPQSVSVVTRDSPSTSH